MDKLLGKVILVVGGAGLLGRALCFALAKEGARVVCADLDEARADSVVRDLSKGHDGLRMRAAGINISERESIDGLIRGILETEGKLDGVVNSAYPRNKNYGRKLEDVSYESFNENVGLHLGGYFLVCQRVAAALKNSGGSFVNLGSIYGVTAPRFEIYEGTAMTMPVEYAAIKAGLIHLTKYFASYYRGTGLRFNCVSPGGILDGQPSSFLEKYGKYANAKGMLEPQDICGAVVFLLSDDGKYVQGQNLIVDDGWSL